MECQDQVSPPKSSLRQWVPLGPLFPLTLMGVMESFFSQVGVELGCSLLLLRPCLNLPLQMRSSLFSAAAVAHEKALVDALITSVRETLKMENASGATTEVSVPFGTHKPPFVAKVFP